MPASCWAVMCSCLKMPESSCWWRSTSGELGMTACGTGAALSKALAHAKHMLGILRPAAALACMLARHAGPALRTAYLLSVQVCAIKILLLAGSDEGI
jgi:hypothetical protein